MNNLREDVIKEITERISNDYPDFVKAETMKVSKVNREVEELVIVTRDRKASPAISLDFIMEIAEDKGVKFAADCVYDMFKNAYEKSPSDEEIEFKKEKFFACLVNKSENAELLASVPHREFLDMAIICRVFFNESKSGDIASSIITNDLLTREIKLDENELLDLAISNTRNLFPVTFRSMSEIISEMMGMPADMASEIAGPGMYVISNNKGLNGATNIIYTDVLEDIAKKIGEKFYIIPSSIHECIVIPISDDVNESDEDKIAEMIYEVNSSQVDESERLSNNLYMYISGESIMIVKESDKALV
ncbi:MAG: DUF5688 family protein [Lachnospiraceae bacterium]|nr:DUF5688 family protein [Lachnospiraceae bacterium]